MNKSNYPEDPSLGNQNEQLGGWDDYGWADYEKNNLDI